MPSFLSQEVFDFVVKVEELRVDNERLLDSVTLFLLLPLAEKADLRSKDLSCLGAIIFESSNEVELRSNTVGLFITTTKKKN